MAYVVEDMEMTRIIDHTIDDTYKIMADSTKAWPTRSNNLFVRREFHSPQGHVIHIQSYPWNHIAYYDKNSLERLYLAEARCLNCNTIVRSKHCGDFATCNCGKIFVDTNRWFPNSHRYGGNSKDMVILH